MAECIEFERIKKIHTELGGKKTGNYLANNKE